MIGDVCDGTRKIVYGRRRPAAIDLETALENPPIGLLQFFQPTLSCGVDTPGWGIRPDRTGDEAGSVRSGGGPVPDAERRQEAAAFLSHEIMEDLKCPFA
jgi:hypothetical protein